MATSWTGEWADIIRYIIWPDPQMRSLMLIPQSANIIDFRDKYFIRSGYTSQPLINEDVRIVYSNINSYGLVPNVLRQNLSFDIYIKREKLYDATDDRLIERTVLIAERLKHLLSMKDSPYIGGYHFVCVGQTDLGTSAVGYVRYNITFAYNRTT